MVLTPSRRSSPKIEGLAANAIKKITVKNGRPSTPKLAEALAMFLAIQFLQGPEPAARDEAGDRARPIGR